MSWTGWCAGPRQAVAAAGQINHGVVDWFTLAHAGVGMVLVLFRLGLGPTLALGVGWEIAEHLLKDCAPGAFMFPSQDTLANAAGDVLAVAAGWGAARPLAAEPAAQSTARSSPSAANSRGR